MQSAVTGGSIQLQHDQRDETLGRLVWRRKDLAGWSVELGGEAAFNRLDSHVDLYSLRGDGGRVRTDLPTDDAVVEERRGEVFANLGRAWTPRLRMDAGLRYESRWRDHALTWRLNVDNVFDRFYWRDTGSTGGDRYLFPGAPRLARLSLTVAF